MELKSYQQEVINVPSCGIFTPALYYYKDLKFDICC